MRDHWIRIVVLSSAMAATVAVSPGQAQVAAPQPPAADEVIRRACDAAGGIDKFRALGIVQATVKRTEFAEDGTQEESETVYFLRSPGVLPARLENVGAKLVAGDDGTGGWAVNSGAVDQRPATVYMVERVIRTALFPLLMPFSLTWEGVSVRSVAADQVDGKPAWRLDIVMPVNFFFTPQISNSWRIFVARENFALLKAESPPTDIGKNVTLDGMRVTWSRPVGIGDVWLPGKTDTIGIDLKGELKAHNRTETAEFRLLPVSEGPKLFPNPIPQDKRPKPFKMETPAKPLPQPGT